MSILGGSIIWAGWYSFNGGASYKANYVAVGAILNTHLSACCSAVCWLLLSYRKDKYFRMTALIGGTFAGLSSITARSGYVSPWASCVIGIIIGSSSYFAVGFFKHYLNLDDVLDVMAL